MTYVDIGYLKNFPNRFGTRGKGKFDVYHGLRKWLRNHGPSPDLDFCNFTPGWADRVYSCRSPLRNNHGVWSEASSYIMFVRIQEGWNHRKVVEVQQTHLNHITWVAHRCEKPTSATQRRHNPTYKETNFQIRYCTYIWLIVNPKVWVTELEI